jgi:hypothetical protein
LRRHDDGSGLEVDEDGLWKLELDQLVLGGAGNGSWERLMKRKLHDLYRDGCEGKSEKLCLHKVGRTARFKTSNLIRDFRRAFGGAAQNPAQSCFSYHCANSGAPVPCKSRDMRQRQNPKTNNKVLSSP